MRGLSKTSRVLCLALLAAGVAWLALFLLNPSGVEARVFFESGRDLFGDFRMPRVCAAFGYANEMQPRRDSCYPALASLLVHPFPTWAGARFACLGLAVWVGAFLVFAGTRGQTVLLPVALISSIMLFTLERANPILFAAAGCLLFLAWFDSDRTWRRWLACLGLAVAAALKLTPTVLALLFLLRVRRHGVTVRAAATDAAVFVVCAALLFFAPFAAYGGVDGFCQWWSNAAANAAHYAHTGSWGVLAVGRTVRAVLHLDVSRPWSGMGAERCVDAVGGLACLALAVLRLWRRRGTRGGLVLLVVAGLLLVPGNMHFYTGLYLLPVFALRLREGLGRFEAACWFVLLCPLQIPFGGGCLNHPLANLAFLGLVGVTVADRGEDLKQKPIIGRKTT